MGKGQKQHVSFFLGHAVHVLGSTHSAGASLQGGGEGRREGETPIFGSYKTSGGWGWKT